MLLFEAGLFNECIDIFQGHFPAHNPFYARANEIIAGPEFQADRGALTAAEKAAHEKDLQGWVTSFKHGSLISKVVRLLSQAAAYEVNDLR